MTTEKMAEKIKKARDEILIEIEDALQVTFNEWQAFEIRKILDKFEGKIEMIRLSYRAHPGEKR